MQLYSYLVQNDSTNVDSNAKSSQIIWEYGKDGELCGTSGYDDLPGICNKVRHKPFYNS